MTREIILQAIANDKDVKAACVNILRGKDTKDFYQHIMLIICEIGEEKLIDIYTNGYLRWYIVKIIMNEGADWLKGKANLEYLDEITDVEDEPYNGEIDREVEVIECRLDCLPEYEKRLFLEYMKAGSYRKLETVVGISYRTIGNKIKSIKKQLNEDIRSRGI